MDDKTQERFETLLATAIGLGLTRFVAQRFIEDIVPERREITDDLFRAALRGATTATATVLASVTSRWLTHRRQ